MENKWSQLDLIGVPHASVFVTFHQIRLHPKNSNWNKKARVSFFHSHVIRGLEL